MVLSWGRILVFIKGLGGWDGERGEGRGGKGRHLLAKSVDRSIYLGR